jgi:methionyl-tRNA formyltransferase
MEIWERLVVSIAHLENQSSPRSVLLMGKGELAIKIAAYLKESPHYDLVGVVPCSPEPKWCPSLVEWASVASVPIVVSGRVRDTPCESVDLGISCYYDKILDNAELSLFREAINIHNSVLPKYRGIAPIEWALKNGELTHGVTIHCMDDGIDTGAIVGQVVFDIWPWMSASDVYRACLGHGWILFRTIADRLDFSSRRVQEAEAATYYSSTDARHVRDDQGNLN